MGMVWVVKNNDINNDIYDNALESYDNKVKKYYNTVDNSPNEAYVQRAKENFEGEGIILLITYDKQERYIQEVFIGDSVEVTEKNNIKYIMRRHLNYRSSERAIQSIVDRIDLDLAKDFEDNCYVILCEMENLYEELAERIKSASEVRDVQTYKSESTYDGIFQMSKLAQRDKQIIRIFPSDNVGEGRTEFQRDRERVVNCKAFRRLVDKAQIFGSEKGDYFRTRMTHTLEVNQIAKAIAYALGLNLDLTEAIALGHDLGHTPFGHQGERTLDEILGGDMDAGIVIDERMLAKRCFGSFKHNYQSARILTQLEEKYEAFPGLNVSVQVVEGVLKHTKLKEYISIDDFLDEKYWKKMNLGCNDSATMEGQAVAIADEIAQRGHDVDDALTSGVISLSDFLDLLRIGKCKELRSRIEEAIDEVDESSRLLQDKYELKIARIISVIVNYMIMDTIENSKKKIMDLSDVKEITMTNSQHIISFSEETKSVNAYLENVIQKRVICNSEVARADYNGKVVVKTLFEIYYSNPRLLHKGTLHKMFIETLNHKDLDVSNSAVNLNDGKIKLINKEIKEITKTELSEESVEKYLNGIEMSLEDKIRFEKRKILVRCIVDYIAGMTDGYAMQEFDKLR